MSDLKVAAYAGAVGLIAVFLACILCSCSAGASIELSIPTPSGNLLTTKYEFRNPVRITVPAPAPVVTTTTIQLEK